METTKVTRRQSFHSMSISAKFPSGAKFTYSIKMNDGTSLGMDETLSLAFSNDEVVLRKQMEIFKMWLKKFPKYIDRFDNLEKMSKSCKSGLEFINLMLD